MRNLFIIGNGFDLAHGLETSYNDFIKSFQKKVNNNDKILHYILLNEYNNAHRNWSDIEMLYFNILNNYNNKTYLYNHHRIRTTYNNSKDLNHDFNILKLHLNDYLEIQQKKIKSIKALEYLFSVFNEKETLVLNFNYTNTLSQYLQSNNNIKCINIHGEINNVSNPMIFGFAANDKDSEILIKKNDNELMRNIKRINYNITTNFSDFNLKMSNSNEKFDIFILGHSCGISDNLILSEIFNHINTNTITPFFYNDNEGYIQTNININRIVDDYSKNDQNDYSFHKLRSLPHCIRMIQHNSTEDEIKTFKAKVHDLKSNQKPLPIRHTTKVT
ncbi:MAG: AbiH family protein [Paludibacter sp.]|nr:AbiH family protein [Paludibacter sp.]